MLMTAAGQRRAPFDPEEVNIIPGGYFKFKKGFPAIFNQLPGYE